MFGKGLGIRGILRSSWQAWTRRQVTLVMPAIKQPVQVSHPLRLHANLKVTLPEQNKDLSSWAARIAGDSSKRLRNLQKKLRQIEELKQKAAAGSGLSAEQREKVAQETALCGEIKELEGHL